MQTRSIRTNWFEYTIYGVNGGDFYTLTDLCAHVEIYDDGEIASVENIFTNYSDKSLVFLASDHPLYALLERHIMDNQSAMVPDDWEEQFEPDEYDRADADHRWHEGD